MSDTAINDVLAQMRVIAARAAPETGPARLQADDGDSFSSLMQTSIEEVNASMMRAKAMATAFETGDPDISLAEVMLASQRAGLQFQATTEIRNKFLTAYQEIMNMQV